MDAAIVDGTAHLNAMAATSWPPLGVQPERRRSGLLDGGTPYYDLYETADGKHVSVGALEPQFYAELVELLGLNDPAPDRDDPAALPGCATCSPRRSAAAPRPSGPRSSTRPTPASRRCCR